MMLLWSYCGVVFIEDPWLSIMKQVQPIRMSHLIHEREVRRVTACFPHKLKHDNGAKNWLISNKKTFKLGKGALN